MAGGMSGWEGLAKLSKRKSKYKGMEVKLVHLVLFVCVCVCVHACVCACVCMCGGE